VHTIYIVEGETGEYSDRSSWLVSTHLSLASASKRMDFLNKQLEDRDLDMYNKAIDTMDRERFDLLSSEMEAFDSQFRCDYTGARYSIVQAPLLLDEDVP
jgi:hypothetical protein